MFLFRKSITLLILTTSLLMTANRSAVAGEVQLEDVDGKQHLLSEYIGQGKWTVLNIWGPGCPPCIEEMPELSRFHDKFHKKTAIVVGIAIDFPSYGYAKKEKVRSFMDEYLIEFPVLLSDESISRKLDAGRLEGLPTTYIYTPEGKMVAMQVGAITGSLLENFISQYEEKNKVETK